MTTDQAEYAQQIEQIVVDKDEIVKHYTKNLRNQTLYDARKFRLTGFRNDGVAGTKVGVDPRDNGAYYDSSPHPIWLPPRAFIDGADPRDDSDGRHEDIGLPDETENRRILRNDSEFEEGTDEFEEAHKQSMAEWKTMWENAIEDDLKDELTFEFAETEQGRQVGTITHTVDVAYE